MAVKTYFNNVHTLLTNSFGQQTSFWSNLGQEAGIETVNLLVGAAAGAVATGGAGVAVTIGIAAGTALVNTVGATRQARQTAVAIGDIAGQINGNFLATVVAARFELHSIAVTNHSGIKNIHLFESHYTQRIVTAFNSVLQPPPNVSQEHTWQPGCGCWSNPMLRLVMPSFGRPMQIVPTNQRPQHIYFTVGGIINDPIGTARITRVFCGDLNRILNSASARARGGN